MNRREQFFAFRLGTLFLCLILGKLLGLESDDNIKSDFGELRDKISKFLENHE